MKTSRRHADAIHTSGDRNGVTARLDNEDGLDFEAQRPWYQTPSPDTLKEFLKGKFSLHESGYEKTGLEIIWGPHVACHSKLILSYSTSYPFIASSANSRAASLAMDL
jgi:hypothetical protein